MMRNYSYLHISNITKKESLVLEEIKDSLFFI